ncbi:MAG TPA: MGMT family protein [Membranihabitans sp.]|nr:MGMT family protein [Membranihabitans sp.]
MNKSYYEEVYEVVRQIPYGRVTTYGIIADYLTLGSARMVGYALRQHHPGYGYIPAHRVVNASGILTGKNQFPYPDYMADELRKEGVEVANDKVVNFREKIWVPA